MPIAPAIACERTAAGVRLDLSGGWTIDVGARLEKEADALVGDAEGAHEALIDLSGVEAMDTAGAWVIDRSVQALATRGVATQLIGARPEHAILLKEAHYRPVETAEPCGPPTLTSLLADIGESVYGAGSDFVNGVAFLGRLVSVGLTVLVRPPRWRWTSTFHHLEIFGLRSTPSSRSTRMPIKSTVNGDALKRASWKMPCWATIAPTRKLISRMIGALRSAKISR